MTEERHNSEWSIRSVCGSKFMSDPEPESSDSTLPLQHIVEKYSSILSMLPEGIVIYDSYGKVFAMNGLAEEILGVPFSKLKGAVPESQYPCFHEDGTPFSGELPSQTVLKTGNPLKGALMAIKMPDNTERWISMNAHPLYFNDKTEKPEAVLCAFNDITERKKTEEKLEIQRQQLMHADKLISLGTLVSGIAHEINNPNNFIALNAPFLSELWQHAKPKLDEYYKRHGDFNLGNIKYSQLQNRVEILFDDIIDGTHRIQKIVQELRNFSRPDNSELNDDIDINTVIRSSITIMNNKIKKSADNFQIFLGSGLPVIKGSFQKLEQVIINLLQNACEALKSGSDSITISSSFDKENSLVKIMVKDTGEGIAPEIINRITDPFFTTKRNEGGTGLGLSICQQIVDLHHGKLEIQSEPGKETAINVFLPA